MGSLQKHLSMLRKYLEIDNVSTCILYILSFSIGDPSKKAMDPFGFQLESHRSDRTWTPAGSLACGTFDPLVVKDSLGGFILRTTKGVNDNAGVLR